MLKVGDWVTWEADLKGQRGTGIIVEKYINPCRHACVVVRTKDGHRKKLQESWCAKIRTPWVAARRGPEVQSTGNRNPMQLHYNLKVGFSQ